jgi:hypothetical protein
MTYYRVSIQGTLGSSEKWSVNPCFATSFPGTPSVPDLQAAADAIAKVDVPTALAGAKSFSAPVTNIRVEARSDTHVLELAAEAAFTGKQTGGTEPKSPPQTSVVLSLRTDTPGASGRGRLYWPGLGLPVANPSLRIPPTTRDGVAAAAVTYLRAVQDALKAGISPTPSAATFELAIFSKTRGIHSLVNRIMVGDVFDTQRRRRDALPESYVTATFPS